MSYCYNNSKDKKATNQREIELRKSRNLIDKNPHNNMQHHQCDIGIVGKTVAIASLGGHIKKYQVIATWECF